MKKILFTLLVLLSALVLVACTPKDSNTYRTYTSGTAKLNPYSESLATASELFDYVTDSLYTGDYDWDKAIAEGTATKVGDFTNAASLPYARVPRMAAGEPVDVKGDGTVWEITLRTDLKFQDGTPINANTFDYSWRQLLDPDQLNVRASNLYDASNLPLVNAEAYTKQKSPKSDSFGEFVWLVDGKEVSIANAYSHEVGGYDYYFATVEGYFVEFYGASYASYFPRNYSNWALTDVKGNPLNEDAAGNLSKLPNGDANPAFDAESAQEGYVSGRPQLRFEDGAVVPVAENGDPVGGTKIPNDPMAWANVGFKVTGTHKFQITLTEPKDAWYVKGQLMSGITGVVHEAKYEAGKSADKRTTTYGTIDNPLVSYGAYNLIEWQDGVLYLYERNDDHYAAEEYRIKRIRYDVIADQSIAVNEFKAGRLDIVGASGEYFKEFKDSPTLKLTPATTFFRFAFNIDERPDGTTNPILTYKEFRQAFYYAIDREEFASEVRAPAYANQGFIGPVYIATEYGSVSYRGSDAGKAVFAPLSPETTGFNPTKAKQLFDAAYAKSVADGNIKNGDKVTVEYTYYKVETNDTVANWVKQTVETIFGDKFELKLNGVSSDALDAAWDNFDFDMTFGGWQGLNFNPVSLMGQVYNSISGASNMLENGFDTGNILLTIELPHTKAALQKWVAEFNEETASEAQLAAYGRWTAALAKFGDSNTYSDTLDNVYKAAASTFYNVSDVNYAGRNDDFDRITAAFEAALLDEMIAIPLFTSVSATVYSSRVKFEATEYHAWMGWGGLKYMYLD